MRKTTKTKTTLRITEITTEHVALQFIGKTSRIRWCAQCGCNSQMIASEAVTGLTRINQNTLHDWIESGRAHSLETPEGRVLLCLNSLFNRI